MAFHGRRLIFADALSPLDDLAKVICIGDLRRIASDFVDGLFMPNRAIPKEIASCLSPEAYFASTLKCNAYRSELIQVCLKYLLVQGDENALEELG